MELFLNAVSVSLALSIIAALSMFCLTNLPEDNPGYLPEEDAKAFMPWAIVPGINVLLLVGVILSFACAFLNLFFTDKDAWGDDDDDFDETGW